MKYDKVNMLNLQKIIYVFILLFLFIDLSFGENDIEFLIQYSEKAGTFREHLEIGKKLEAFDKMKLGSLALKYDLDSLTIEQYKKASKLATTFKEHKELAETLSTSNISRANNMSIQEYQKAADLAPTFKEYIFCTAQSMNIKEIEELQTKKLNFQQRQNKRIIFIIIILLLINNLIWLILYQRKVKINLINPYKAGKALEEDDSFFGRTDILEFIKDKVIASDQPDSITLYGVRKMGKSSILKKIYRTQEYLSVYISFHDIAIDLNSNNDFFIDIKNAVMKELDKRKIIIKYGEVNDKKTFENFIEVLDNNLKTRLIIMFDEFQNIASLIDENKLTKDLLSFLRSLIQNLNNISFILCGTDHIKELTSDYFSAFFNMTHYRKVSFLNERNARDLIKVPLKGRIVYQKKAVDYIIDLTNGQPYFIQLICSNIVNEVRRKNLKKIKIKNVKSIVDELFETGENHFSYVTKTGVLEKLVLSIIAINSNKNKYVKFDQILKIIKDYQFNIDNNEKISLYLNELCDKDLLVEDKNIKQYKFTMDLIRQWVLKDLPINKILEEYQ
ncbi:hypothetical protein GMMP15_1120006 [Candidatus Magnetomoraceae bacterium gMMP-15]